MPFVTIQVPFEEGENSMEIEVVVNGTKRKIQYRVEVVNWDEDCEDQEIRIQCLRRHISNKKRDWQLMNIGAPGDHHVPVLFKKLVPSTS
jgi:hypothetical protein